MRNILGERVLGLPGDLRAADTMAWKEIPVAEFVFTDEQVQLRSAVRKFAGEQAGETAARRVMESDPPYDAAVWARLGAELGVLGLSVSRPTSGAAPWWTRRSLSRELGAALTCDRCSARRTWPSRLVATSGAARAGTTRGSGGGRRTAASSPCRIVPCSTRRW